MSFKLEAERSGITHKATIGGTDVYFRTGETSDGRLGELFITINKQGDELRCYDALAIAISIGLQYGIPLEKFIDELKGQSWEPSGITNNPKIPIAKSIVDYMARWLELKYSTNYCKPGLQFVRKYGAESN